MIEAVMLAALGFLVATALWLMLLPAISNRADRLARRRAELSFPLSVDEISAERDHLRAEFAVRQRELERRAEEHQSQRVAALGSVGALDMQISELKTTLGVRDFTILDLETNLASTRTELSTTQARLAAEEATLAATRIDLADRVLALSASDADLAAVRNERADLTETLAARVEDLKQSTELGTRLAADLAETRSALATLESRHAVLQAEARRLDDALQGSERVAAERASVVDDLKKRLAEIEAQLASEQSGHATTRSAFDQRGTELGALLAERENLRQRLKASDDTVAKLDQTLTDLRSAKATSDANTASARNEVERANALLRKLGEEKARIEVEAASARRERDARIEALASDLAVTRDTAAAGRAERADLKQELAALRRDAERATMRIDAENAQLRSEILKVADQFLGLKTGGQPASQDDAKGRSALMASPEPVQEASSVPTARLPRERRSAAKMMQSPVPDRAAE